MSESANNYLRSRVVTFDCEIRDLLTRLDSTVAIHHSRSVIDHLSFLHRFVYSFGTALRLGSRLSLIMTKQDVDAIATGNNYDTLKESENTTLNTHIDDASSGSAKSSTSAPSIKEATNNALNSKQGQQLSYALGNAIAQTQLAAEGALQKIKLDLQNRPIEDHSLTALSCFLVLCTLRWFTIGHSTPLISFALFFQIAFFMAAATVIQGQTFWQQYSSSLVFCTVLHLVGLVGWPLVMAGFPVLITYTKRQLVESAKKVQ